MIKGCLSLIFNLFMLPLKWVVGACLTLITLPLNLITGFFNTLLSIGGKTKRRGHRSRSDYQRRYRHMRALGYDPARARRGAKGCYIATAVYGSYDCPAVWTLRRYRDERLAASLHGRLFIKSYYAVSPTLVSVFGDAVWFRRLGRFLLDRFVSKLQSEGFSSTPYND